MSLARFSSRFSLTPRKSSLVSLLEVTRFPQQSLKGDGVSSAWILKYGMEAFLGCIGYSFFFDSFARESFSRESFSRDSCLVTQRQQGIRWYTPQGYSGVLRCTLQDSWADRWNAKYSYNTFCRHDLHVIGVVVTLESILCKKERAKFVQNSSSCRQILKWQYILKILSAKKLLLLISGSCQCCAKTWNENLFNTSVGGSSHTFHTARYDF